MIRHAILGAAAAAVALHSAGAQAVVTRTVDVQPPVVTVLKGGGDRVMLGITVQSGTTARDTLGILITNVATASIAEKGGLEEGARIATVNGVNLRLSAADVGQVDMQGVMQRRFQREMAKVRPGDTVRLSVFADSRFRNVSLASEPLKVTATHRFFMGPDADRASLGAIVGGTASVRDTLGVLITAVGENGPLAKAGVFEGARIAQIGTVDLRVAASSAGNAQASSEKANLLVTEVGKLTVGASVQLRVYEAGRFRNVTVQAMRRGDIQMPGGTGMTWSSGDNLFHLGDNTFHFNDMGGAFQGQILHLDSLLKVHPQMRLKIDSTLKLLPHHVIQPQRVIKMTPRLEVQVPRYVPVR
jgi:predicted metalloprotease with PDZ domain